MLRQRRIWRRSCGVWRIKRRHRYSLSMGLENRAGGRAGPTERRVRKRKRDEEGRIKRKRGQKRGNLLPLILAEARRYFSHENEKVLVAGAVSIDSDFAFQPRARERRGHVFCGHRNPFGCGFL